MALFLYLSLYLLGVTLTMLILLSEYVEAPSLTRM